MVLEGEVTLEVGGATVVAGRGDVAFGPRDVPHRYVVGADGCRMLFVCTPGGLEGLVRDMSEPARERALPPPDGGERISTGSPRWPGPTAASCSAAPSREA